MAVRVLGKAGRYGETAALNGVEEVFAGFRAVMAHE